ncbi:MAG: glycosyltransferase family 4 protein [Acidobacteriaceae bacterium]|nr:glycosyltransferase family 4 protein [Acidobacteriaceae bacterium]
MRIALDATYSLDPQPSGIAIYSRELLSGLSQKYTQDQFLFCYRAKQRIRAPRSGQGNVRLRLLHPLFSTFSADVFHGLNQRVDWRPGKKVVSTFHDLFVITGEYSSREFRERFTKQAKRAARNSDLIIAVSEFTANQVSSLLAVDRSRIRVVPHGVRQPSSDAVVQREPIILFVGALQIRKNVARLVEAFERLPDEGRHWRLVLAGAQSGYQARGILERIERSACRERIRLTGYVSGAELAGLYSRASIFVLPSLDEGFGIPVLEAMAHGAPVVTSNRSALVEVAGEAAILVDPYSVDELASALVRLIQDPDLRGKLSDLGRARARSYTWERAVEATYSIYRELLNGM